MKKAYGGVVIDLDGQVLLREPVDSHRGVRWTFAKGKPRPGETPEETALREVLEETGVRAKVLTPLAGWFNGSHSNTQYFLMLPLEVTSHYDQETRKIRWADQDRAAALIAQTLKPNRRARDLRVLEIAYNLFRTLVADVEATSDRVLVS